MKKTEKLKVMTVLGTRPEIVRLSAILPRLDKYTNHKIVYTNQNYDYFLSVVFFKELNLRDPDYLLEVKSKTLGEQISKILKQTEEIFIKEKPDILFVLGDTNSSLSTIIARRFKIPIFHMEAGNRAFDKSVPEEANRKIVDHISDFNIAYTEHARRYLINEGIPAKNIFVVGSPLNEVISKQKEKIDASNILKKLKLESNNYFLASIHREENIEDEDTLRELLISLNSVACEYNLPLIFSLHPRTKKRIDNLRIKLSKLIVFKKPFGFFDYCKLQKKSLCVFSDSGSIQEESAIMGFNAIQVRNSTERPEAFDTGSIILSGFNKNTLLNSLKLLIDIKKEGEKIIIPVNYRNKNVSTKVVKIIIGIGSIIKERGSF